MCRFLAGVLAESTAPSPSGARHGLLAVVGAYPNGSKYPSPRGRGLGYVAGAVIVSDWVA